MKRALFLVLHRKNRSPGQRYRHEQYLAYLKNHGIECDFSPMLTRQDDRIFYGSGSSLKKVGIGLRSLIKRFKDILQAKNYDIIYIYRDAFFFGTFVERLIKRSTKARIIYDFDDAIWLPDKNPNQGILQKLKNPKKTIAIIKLADTVIAGNEYLKAFADQYNPDVSIIPSTIDFNTYQPISKKDNDRVCIGWTGSFSTIKHFETITSALARIKEKYGSKVYFKLIGDPTYENKALDIKGVKWEAETEAKDLSELDIGLMPLPDDEWSRGKCAMKGLQYMALEIPTIMSPVGVNKDIIQDGVNGFLAATEDEWVEKLSILIGDQQLRKTIGKAGRRTVEKDYSVEANKDKWLRVFLND